MGAPSLEPVTRSSERRGPCTARDWPEAANSARSTNEPAKRADLRADGGAGERGAEDGDAGGQRGSADGGAGDGESEGGHGGVWGGGEW